MTRSKQRTHCHRSCFVCHPQNREPYEPKASDRRRMQGDFMDYERDGFHPRELARAEIGGNDEK